MKRMTRLLDIGITQMTNIIIGMAEIGESAVIKAIEAYEKGAEPGREIFDTSEKLRMLQEEASELAVELFARYQPVASDLRFIKSCMEISYALSRYGRYAYDIVDTIDTMGSIERCDKSAVVEMADIATKMIQLSVTALRTQDKDAAKRLYEMDDSVDALFRKFLRQSITPKGKKGSNKIASDPRCFASNLLTLRYLERISDHACYIGDSVHYAVTGETSPRD